MDRSRRGRGNGPLAPLLICIGRRAFLLRRQDVAGFGLVVKMEFDTACVELAQYRLDAPLDRRMVRAVAADEFLDNSPQRRAR